VTKCQRSWWVKWPTCRRLSVGRPILELFLFSHVKSDFDETWYECYVKARGYKVTKKILNICINYAN